MLQFCSDYAFDINILFNPNKFHCLKLCKYVNTANVIQFPMFLEGIQLTRADNIIHLGHYLITIVLDSADIEHRRIDFYSQKNLFFVLFWSCDANY